MDECLYKHSPNWFACACPNCIEERKLAHEERVAKVRAKYLENENDDVPLFIMFQQPVALIAVSMLFLAACLLQAFYGPAREQGDYIAGLWAGILFFAGIYLLTGALFCFHLICDHPIKVLLLGLAGLSACMIGYGPAVSLMVGMVPIILTLTRWDELATLFGLHVISATLLIISIAMFANHFGIDGNQYQHELLSLLSSLKIR